MPKAAAPPRQAMCSTSSGWSAVASRRWTFWSSAVAFITSNMSWRLLLPGPSLARATAMPRRLISTTGATPEARYMFDTGQWTTTDPDEAIRSSSPSSSQTLWASWTSGPRAPSDSSHFTCRIPRSWRLISTSTSVSAQWTWVPRPQLRAAATVARMASSEQPQGMRGANSTRIRSSWRPSQRPCTARARSTATAAISIRGSG